MYVGHQENLLSQQRHQELTAEADGFRAGSVLRAGRTSLRDRIGAMLLQWGRSLCESDGEVTVEIAFSVPGKDHHRHHAA